MTLSYNLQLRTKLLTIDSLKFEKQNVGNCN